MKEFIREHDEEALKSLKLVKSWSSADKTKPYDFTLTFIFGPNDFFENTELTIKFSMKDE